MKAATDDIASMKVHVLVDNDSWIMPYAKDLVKRLNDMYGDATLCRNHGDIKAGDVSFFLGCLHIVPPEALAKSKRNLVVHASDLPKGRGFSPWTWLVLEGSSRIPVCLLDAAKEVDAGPIVFKDEIKLAGHELVDEIRKEIGNKTVELCLRFLSDAHLPEGAEQAGESTYYPRRRPKDSELDPRKSIAEQFNLLRVVDNEDFPAFFELNGHTYRLKIEKTKR